MALVKESKFLNGIIEFDIAFSVVAGQQAEVYMMDMETPALFIPELKRASALGQVGLSAGAFAPVHYSNYSFVNLDAPNLKGKAKPQKPMLKGLITAWSVSSGFPEVSLRNKLQLSDSNKVALIWKKLECEATGVANLARVAVFGEWSNTAFGMRSICR